MKTKIILLVLLLSISSLSAKKKEFPIDDYNYRSNIDTGFDQYRTTSLRGTKKIALTFDDGPHLTRTPILLDLLKKYNVKATFFILTKKINSKTLPILKRILKEGHILASHDQDHDNNNRENESTFYHELKNSINDISNIVKETGVSQQGVYYRFPGGNYGKASNYHHMNIMKDISDEIFGENCINFAFWDIDSADWGPKMTPKMISQNIISHIIGGKTYSIKVKRTFFGKINYKIIKNSIVNPIGGGVVLMHDIHQRSIDAAAILLKELLKQRIEVVPLNTIREFSYNGKNCIL